MAKQKLPENLQLKKLRLGPVVMKIRNALKITGLLGLLGFGIVALICGVAQRDPLWLLPAPRHDLSADRKTLEPFEGRRMEHVSLHGGGLGDIGFVVSLPALRSTKKLPVLVVLGGLNKGENNIRYIKYAGNNAIVGYDWPLPVKFPDTKDFPFQAPGLYRHALTVPGQIASMVYWLSKQPWADASRISLLGFSLGALATPAAQALIEHDGQHIGWTIIAYGGAPFGQLFVANPYMKLGWIRAVAPPLIDTLLYPLEPTVHLPRLKGRFLVLEGTDDEFVPEEARRRLREAVPEPKTIITFTGTHIGVGPYHLALLERIIDTSRKWLIENGAVNP